MREREGLRGGMEEGKRSQRGETGERKRGIKRRDREGLRGEKEKGNRRKSGRQEERRGGTVG